MCKLPQGTLTSILWIPPLSYLHTNTNPAFIDMIGLSLKEFLRNELHCAC